MWEKDSVRHDGHENTAMYSIDLVDSDRTTAFALIIIIIYNGAPHGLEHGMNREVVPDGVLNATVYE